MKVFSKNLIEVEIHQLKMSFNAGRLQDPKAVIRLAESMACLGQKLPVIAVETDGEKVLVDGYLRVAAALRCGWDVIWVEVWSCDVATGLLRVLAAGQARKWEPLEEGYLIQELTEDGGMTLKEVAMSLGRDISWVSRRLAMITELSEVVLQAVRRGDVSPWSAERIMVPLERANSEHAKKLVEALDKEPMSTRQLDVFFKHYRKTTKQKREQMIADPSLYIRAIEAHQKEQEAKILERGVEGDLKSTLKQLRGLMARLLRQTQEVYACGDESARANFRAEFDDVDTQWQSLKTEIGGNPNDPTIHATNDPGARQDRSVDPTDQQNPEDLAQHGAQSSTKATTGEQARGGEEEQRRGGEQGRGGGGARGPCLDQDVVCTVQGQRGSPPGNPRGGVQQADGVLKPNEDCTRGPPA